MESRMREVRELKRNRDKPSPELKRMSTPIGETEMSAKEKLEYDLMERKRQLENSRPTQKTCAESCRDSSNRKISLVERLQ